MSFLSDFFYGNIAPQDRYIKKGSEAAKIMHSLTRLISVIDDLLDDNGKRHFQEYRENRDRMDSLEALDAFITGFRMGSKCIYDAFVSEDAPCCHFENIDGDEGW